MTAHPESRVKPDQRSLTSHLLRGIVAPTVAVMFILLLVLLLGTSLIVQDIINQQTLLINTLARQGDQYLVETSRLMQALAGTLFNLPSQQRDLLFVETREAYPRFTAFYLLNAEGIVRAENTDRSPLLGLDLSGEKYFQHARDAGEIYYSEPFIPLGLEKVSVTVATPILVNGEFRGVLVGELNLELLQDVIESATTGPGAVSYIVDHRGTLIAHPSQRWVQERRNLGDIAPTQKELAGDNALFEVFYDHHVEAWLIGSVTQMGQNWRVVTTQPAVVAAQPPIVLAAMSAIAIALSINLFYWFQVRTFRQITRPIALLAEKADALAHGHYQQRLPAETFGRFQELTSLGQSFAQMAQAVEERTSQLVDANQALEKELQERRLAEEALRESEARYRVLVETLPDSVVLADLEGALIAANVQTARLFGYESVDALLEMEQKAQDFFAPENRALADNLARKLLTYGNVRNLDYVAQRVDETTFSAEMSASLVTNTTGEPNAFVGITRDITERKRAEAEVARLQLLLQSITDSMPSALITLDPAGQVMTWNPAASRLVEQDVAVDALLWECCPRLARYRDAFEQVIHEGQVVHRHREHWGNGPQAATYDISIFPLRAETLQGAVMRIDDVTRRDQLEEMMLQSAKMASLGGLAAGVAHEINNPLAAIMQSAEMVQLALDVERSTTQKRLRALELDPAALRQYLKDRGVQDYLDGIRVTGARAAKIVADLLSFSRQRAFNARAHDLNELIEQTLALASTDYDLKRKYDFREIEIKQHLAENLPRVICDGQQIQQVILNLVRNAAQAMTTKRRRAGASYQPHLHIETRQHHQWVRLIVEDNGPGLPEGVEERLFEPFFTTKDVGTGTGLGLWLCWSIVVERHQGQVWAQEGTEGGARFVVELPVMMAPASPRKETDL